MHKKFFDLLKKDHKEVKDILEQLKKATGRAESKREQLFSKLKEEIMPHMEAEEKAFYEPLMEKKEAREKTLEGYEEHHVTELVLKELEGMPKSEEQWAAKLSVFKELVEHHIEEEEKSVFKIAEKALSKEQMQSILENFQEEKEKVKEGVA